MYVLFCEAPRFPAEWMCPSSHRSVSHARGAQDGTTEDGARRQVAEP